MIDEVEKEDSIRQKEEKLTIVKKIARISLWIFCIVGLSILFMKTLSRHEKLTCSNMVIKLENSGGILDRNTLYGLLESRFKVLHAPLSRINLQDMEKFIVSDPYVRNANLFFDLKGVLRISIWEKVPVLSVRNNWNQTYRIDDLGTKMPGDTVSDSSLMRVQGNISEKYSWQGKSMKGRNPVPDTLVTRDMKMVYAFWKNLSRTPEFSKKVVRVDIQNNHLLALRVRSVYPSILIGDTSRMGEKMEKLEILLSTILPKSGMNTYSQIDLRFENQWVCERKPASLITDSAHMNKKINNLL